MTDTTWSVGLPSLSAATQVPASFFIFSRPALVGGVGNLPPGFSSPWLAAARVKRIANTCPPVRFRRTTFIFISPALDCRIGRDRLATPILSNGARQNRQATEKTFLLPGPETGAQRWG